MSVPAYEVMFGKLSLQNLFEDYFDQAGNMTSRIILKALEEPNVDLIGTVSFQTWVLFLLLQSSETTSPPSILWFLPVNVWWNWE